MSYRECEMRDLQSIPSSGKHARGAWWCKLSPGAHCWFPDLHMGLYNKVVTYFFLYRWVALSTITPSWGRGRKWSKAGLSQDSHFRAHENHQGDCLETDTQAHLQHQGQWAGLHPVLGAALWRRTPGNSVVRGLRAHFEKQL